MPQKPAEPPAEPPRQHDVASIMEIMKEIQVIYSDSSSDAKDIAETYRIRKELAALCEQKEADVKSLIKGRSVDTQQEYADRFPMLDLSARVEKAEDAAAGDHMEEHKQKMAELHEQKENVVQNVKALEDSKKSILDSVEQTKALAAKLNDDMDKSESDRVADVPRIK